MLLRVVAPFVATSLLGGMTAAFVVGRIEAGPQPPPVGRPTVVTFRSESDRIHVAGSGSCLPIVEHLLDHFEERARVVLHPSIGSRGALRALERGAIDVGLVSRRMELPSAGRWRWIGLARVEVVFAAHPSVQLEAVGVDDLVAFYQGPGRGMLRGRRALALLREAGDSGLVAIASALPRLGAALERARAEPDAIVLLTDAEMRDALLDMPGAVGPLDIGAVRLQAPSLRVLRVRDAPAIHKELAVVLPARAHPVADRFVRFLQSERARALMRGAGYEPWEGP
ncbi:MAG: hypothetical protein NZ898_12055 [Myxococcota bacterium]|nr:hypothetical protein [Myxococcota bacterium]MDW8360928.1 hypothetical protein [Myxococcales bacterium]